MKPPVPPLPSFSPQKILVIRLGGIGNVMFALPALQALRRRYPNASIDLLSRSYHRPLMEMAGFGFRGLRPRGQSYLSLGESLLERPYDLVVDLQSFGETTLFSRLSRAPLRLGLTRHKWQEFAFHHPTPARPRRPQEHQWQEFMRVLQPLNLTSAPLEPLEAPPALAADARHQLFSLAYAPWVGLNLGASQSAKCLPLETWQKLAQSLAEERFSVLLMIGPGEKSLLPTLRGWLSHPSIYLVYTENLRHLAAYLSSLQYLISADSGPLHLAAVLGVPVLGLYRPGTEHRYAPLISPHKLVISPQMAELSADYLHQNLQDLISMA